MDFLKDIFKFFMLRIDKNKENRGRGVKILRYNTTKIRRLK